MVVVMAGKGRQGGSDDKASGIGSDGVVRAGEGSGDEEDGGDEADEDIHARSKGEWLNSLGEWLKYIQLPYVRYEYTYPLTFRL